jgi:hypothetical protein
LQSVSAVLEDASESGDDAADKTQSGGLLEPRWGTACELS